MTRAGRGRRARLAGAAALLLCGCTTTTPATPSAPVSASPTTATPTETPSVGAPPSVRPSPGAVPPPLRGEIARAWVEGGTVTAHGGAGQVGDEGISIYGHCWGTGSVTYRLVVDGVDTGGGSFPCQADGGFLDQDSSVHAGRHEVHVTLEPQGQVTTGYVIVAAPPA